MADYRAGDTIDIRFTTAVSGVPTSLSGGTVSVYKTNSTTRTTTGVTLTADFGLQTGLNHVRIATAADGTFYADGADFSVVVTAGTVGGSSVAGHVVDTFSLGHESAFSRIGAAGAGLTELGDARIGNLDAAVSSRLATSGYTAPLDAAGTRSAVGLASANLDTQLGAIAGYIDTEVATLVTNVSTILTRLGVPGSDIATIVTAIKAKTDNLTFTSGTSVDANIQAVNDVVLAGTGIAGSDEWRPA